MYLYDNMKQADIARSLKDTPQNVNNTIKRFLEVGSVEDRPWKKN